MEPEVELYVSQSKMLKLVFKIYLRKVDSQMYSY